MKKLFFVIGMLCSIYLLSCKKEKIPTVKEKVIGKWTYVKIGTQKPVGAEEIFDMMPEDAYMDFKDNEIFVYKESGGENSGTWKLLNDYLVMDDRNYTIAKLDAHTLTFYIETVENGKTNRTTHYLTRQ